jgi:hypothetical protein
MERLSKYIKLYYDIIYKAKSENRVKYEGIYYENHHILPKSIYKRYSKTKWNLVLLTAKEHFICHKLLYKHYETIGDIKNYNKMIFAMNRMCNGNSGMTKIIKSSEFEKLRIKFSKVMSERRKNFKHSTETIEKLRVASLGKKFTEESKEKMSESQKKRWTEEERTKQSKRLNGKKKASYNAKIVVCPYCDKEGKGPNMKRYHFDNCKSKPGNENIEHKKPKHNNVTCPHCNKTGWVANMKRYHFDNCRFRTYD